MSNEFKREERYIVFKLSDVERYLTDADRAHLAMMKNEIDAGRDCANKPPFKGLIVESDWPEYEPTWKAIEARVTGAQPAPIEQDTSVRKAWARFSNELHRSPDAPYPGMADAFEQHFSQSFTDREWRAESATWAAAWKAAKRHEAPPAQSIPEGWIRAINEAFVVAHLGVANESDTYEQAKAKLDNLIGFHVDVATDPAVNGGWKLVPIEPTTEMEEAGYYTSGSFTAAAATYAAMLAAAPKPEAKP